MAKNKKDLFLFVANLVSYQD